jgi:hypothetical protein
MKPVHALVLVLASSLAACAHAPRNYSFNAAGSADDIDVIVKTLKQNGLQPAHVDRQAGTVLTQWFDTGYRFREIDDFTQIHYYTDVFLRYRVAVARSEGKESVVLTPEVQRCAPIDSRVTNDGVVGSCMPMTILFPTQQEQVDALGDKLKVAVGGGGPLPGSGETTFLSSNHAR